MRRLGHVNQKKNAKTYNSRYSLVVTHPTTNLPIWCLCMAERTGCPFLTSLWSYVEGKSILMYMYRVVKVTLVIFTVGMSIVSERDGLDDF